MTTASDERDRSRDALREQDPDATKADAQGHDAADPSSFTIDGKPLDVAATYLVGTTDFVAGGSDGYTAFEDCVLAGEAGVDLDALNAYIAGHEAIAPPAANRITRTK